MIYPQKPTQTNTKINEWLRRAWNAMNAGKPVGGPGVRVRTGANGYSIAVEDSRNPFMVYKGTYEPAAGYEVNDMVRVKTSLEYTDSESGANSTKYSLAGVYVCVQYVPPLVDSGDFGGAAEHVRNYIASIARVTGRVYAPIYPEPESNCYWHLIAFAPVQTFICVEGVNTPYYVNASISGSTQVT